MHLKFYWLRSEITVICINLHQLNVVWRGRHVRSNMPKWSGKITGLLLVDSKTQCTWNVSCTGTSSWHCVNMPMQFKPRKPHFIVKSGVYRGMVYFYYFCLKRKIWVLIRTASLRGHVNAMKYSQIWMLLVLLRIVIIQDAASRI